MRRFLQTALVMAFILSLGAAGACKKDEPAAGGGEAAKAGAPAGGEAAKAAPAEEKAAPAEEKPAPAATEEPKEEPKPAAAAADRSKWPAVCQKLSACADALKAGPDSPTKSRVIPTWETMPEMIDENPAEWELGCKTLLEGIAADEGVPDACK